MPIRPEMKARYPKDWDQISRHIRFDRAGNRCEWCGAENRQPHPITGSEVVLTVAHLDHVPENCNPDNLAALCQRCHNRYDGPKRLAGRRFRHRLGQLAAGQLPLQLRDCNCPRTNGPIVRI